MERAEPQVGVERAEPQVAGQLRTVSPRKRAAAVAIAKRAFWIRCRPLRGLGPFFETVPGAYAPGFMLPCAPRTRYGSVKYMIALPKGRGLSALPAIRALFIYRDSTKSHDETRMRKKRTGEQSKEPSSWRTPNCSAMLKDSGFGEIPEQNQFDLARVSVRSSFL